MGEVVEVGKGNARLQVGDRVVVPFTIACGNCYFCKQELWSLCDNSNPNAWMAEKLSGYSGSGLFGACRKGGIVSIPGVYGGWLDKFPLGAAFAKGLTLKMGQTHMHKYLRPLLERIERGEIDPSFVITHRMTLDDAPRMYRTFREKQDECIKVIMKPGDRHTH